MSNATRPGHGRGGWITHKPGCNCNPCASHRRKAEALALTAGDGGTSVEPAPPTKEEVLNADLPVLYTRNRSDRARIGEWIAMRALEPNITIKEAARRMGLVPHSLSALIYRANKAGWLKFEDPLSTIEYEIIPKAIDNLNHFLDKRDKTVTIETAKGTIFRQFQESKGISEAGQTVLALKIEPSESTDIKVVAGHIVGKPRQLED